MKRLLLIGVLFVSACGGGPSGPSTTSVAGTWTGTVNDSLAGVVSASMTLAQSGATVSGTWAVSGNSGSLAGSMSGSSLSAVLSPSNPLTCPYSLTATNSGSRLIGTYAAFNCSIPISGSIALTR